MYTHRGDALPQQHTQHSCLITQHTANDISWRHKRNTLRPEHPHKASAEALQHLYHAVRGNTAPSMIRCNHQCRASECRVRLRGIPAFWLQCSVLCLQLCQPLLVANDKLFCCCLTFSLDSLNRQWVLVTEILDLSCEHIKGLYCIRLTQLASKSQYVLLPGSACQHIAYNLLLQ